MEKSSRDLSHVGDRMAGSILSEPLSIYNLLTTPLEPIEWLVHDLIPTGSMVVFSGKSSDYKTFIELHMATSIASGQPVFGHFETLRSPVLIVDEENSAPLLVRRLNNLSAEAGIPLYFWIREGLKVTNPRYINQIRKFALETGVKLICFDSLIRLHEGDENNAVEMSKVFESFKPLLRANISVLLIHHHRKESNSQNRSVSQSLRGSSDILASADCHLMVERKRDESKLKIIQNKMRLQEEIKPFEVNVVKLEDKVMFEFAGEITDMEVKKELAKPIILKAVGESEKSQKELKELLKDIAGANSVMRALREMVEDGQLEEKTGAKNRKSYQLLTQ